jgi:hypothetical protein
MNFFFVFQNKTYNQERNGEYLWAPKGPCAHWKNLNLVKKGDITFHSYYGNLVALSIAKSDCFEANQPIELQREHHWENDGRRVNCNYFIVPNPIPFADYKEQILRRQPKKYAPFNRLGRGNSGYFYILNRQTADFLLEKLSLQNSNFVDTFKKTALEI